MNFLKEEKMTNNHAPVWLITGSSRGFGKNFVEVALEHGCRVAATARNSKKLHDVFKEQENILLLELDVTNLESIISAINTIIQTWNRIDVLINNAGYGIFGAFEECSINETREIFETNVFGLMNVTRAVLPHMRAQKNGRIVNMGSMGSYACDPGSALYDSAKFAVAGFSEALSKEMKPFGIESMLVEPGMFRTQFFSSESIKTPSHKISAYDDSPARSAMNFCLGMDNLQKGDPKKAVEYIYSIVSSPKPMPLWLPLGKDSFKKFENKYKLMIESVQPYKESGSKLSITDE